jgi:hypothetical protein
LPIRREKEEKKRAKDPSPRSISAASTDAQLPQEMSVPSRRDKEDVSIQEKDRKDKSVEKREEESPVRRAPAKKKRARKMSSSSDSSNSSSSSSSSDSSSSSEGEATAEVKIVDENEEEQLSMLAKKRAARKELRRAVREHGPDLLLKRARAFTAAQRKSREAEKEAKMARAKQQGEEAEAESSEADLAATERTKRGEKEGSTERFVRRRTIEQRFGAPIFQVRLKFYLAQRFHAAILQIRLDFVKRLDFQKAPKFSAKSFQACQNFSLACLIFQRKICKCNVRKKRTGAKAKISKQSKVKSHVCSSQALGKFLL